MTGPIKSTKPTAHFFFSSGGEEVLSSHDENALIYCMQDTLYLMCEDISLSMFQKIEKGKVTVTSEIDLDISIAALKLL